MWMFSTNLDYHLKVHPWNNASIHDTDSNPSQAGYKSESRTNFQLKIFKP